MFKFFICFFVAFSHFLDAGEILDLQTAWERVIAGSPSLAIVDAEIKVREAERRQVSLLPNPIATIEGENIGVNHPSVDTEPPETTFAVCQLIELGGKRCARATFASSVSKLAYWDSQIERQDLYQALTTAFMDVSLAQEKVLLAAEKAAISEETLRFIEIQMLGGKASCLQEKKAIIAQIAAQVFLREAVSNFNLAKKRLALMWGDSHPDFEGVLFDLFECYDPRNFCYLTDSVLQTPDLLRAQAQIFAATQNIKLQKANRVPDVTLTVGYSVFNDASQGGWMVGAQMPLPFFDRNQGNIQKARIEKSQAQFQLDDLIRILKEQIMTAEEGVVVAFDNLSMIKNGALLEAEDAFCLMQRGYENGKIEYLELLDAQKTLFELQEKYLETLYDYHLNRIELERLTGQYL